MTRQSQILAGRPVRWLLTPPARDPTRTRLGRQPNAQIAVAGRARSRRRLIILALVVLLYVDQVLSGTAATIARFSVVLAPILGPLGFFLSTTRPDAEKPNGLINLVYIAAVLLAVGVLIVGISLLVG